MLKDPGGRREARVIGSILEYVFAPADRREAVERLTDPNIRIVSLTVTEGGYNVDHATGTFLEGHPGVQHDVAHPNEPESVFGLVVETLRLRRERGVEPSTVMSCDNIPSNGEITRIAFTSFARLRSAELADWIERSVAFPSSMVDRITPVTTPEDITEVRERFGIDDRWPVVSERFEQWVLEDRFPTGRPPFEQAGVQMVDDVVPYELMKLRLLNCTHQAMCYFGALSGYTYVHEAVGDPLIRGLIRRYMDDEATPTLPPLPGVDLDVYKDTLLERYANPDVKDTLARLCADSSNRIPNWLAPVIREQLAAGRDIGMSAAIVASWARYAEGVDEQGAAIDVVDQDRDRMMGAAQRDRDEPGTFLTESGVFGDLAQHPVFAEAYREAVTLLREGGAQGALRGIILGGAPDNVDISIR
ncbi:mannitol dehydrogenase family protein [Microbacterium sp. Marseille-Q6648]|uniref:mannitol dehydrogenase family protein n=1 Tax=Microbacterium sp. Marseille-Q6648 TaxID=2937991 RepID=UPI00203F6962|nr:mannitol dehydrogenase family protein [Microbacterium sp. Marseille-Q6648]